MRAAGFQFGDRGFDITLLCFEVSDLFADLVDGQAQGQSVGRGVEITLVPLDHAGDFTERETKLLALQDNGEALTIPIAVQADRAAPARAQQPLVFIEAQGAQRYPEVPRKITDQIVTSGVGGVRVFVYMPGLPRRNGMTCMELMNDFVVHNNPPHRNVYANIVAQFSVIRNRNVMLPLHARAEEAAVIPLTLHLLSLQIVETNRPACRRCVGEPPENLNSQ